LTPGRCNNRRFRRGEAPPESPVTFWPGMPSAVTRGADRPHRIIAFANKSFPLIPPPPARVRGLGGRRKNLWQRAYVPAVNAPIGSAPAPRWIPPIRSWEQYHNHPPPSQGSSPSASVCKAEFMREEVPPTGFFKPCRSWPPGAGIATHLRAAGPVPGCMKFNPEEITLIISSSRGLWREMEPAYERLIPG
jgi:hypothetical protein